MKKDLAQVLELEELVLLRKGRDLTGAEDGLEEIDDRICRLRQRMPANLLSQYDKLAKVFSDVVTIAADEFCQGCRRRLSRKTAVLLESAQVTSCEHCGRFLLSSKHAPDYISS